MANPGLSFHILSTLFSTRSKKKKKYKKPGMFCLLYSRVLYSILHVSFIATPAFGTSQGEGKYLSAHSATPSRNSSLSQICQEVVVVSGDFTWIPLCSTALF